MHWTEDYVGLPYETAARGPRSYDCLGLFLHLQKIRHGRDLPDPGGRMTPPARQKAAETLEPLFQEVRIAREGDGLLFRVRSRLHVAYALSDQDMLHATTENGGVAIERWRSTLWFPRLIGIYRYA